MGAAPLAGPQHDDKQEARKERRIDASKLGRVTALIAQFGGNRRSLCWSMRGVFARWTAVSDEIHQYTLSI